MQEKKETQISIITVVYNGVKTLEKTIQSVINQTYDFIEYIIIDGGSKDGTLNIIHKYEKNIDYWVSEPDNGLYDAMNKGIANANGELIGILNSDDWYEPNAVEQIVEAYNNNPNKRIFHGDRYDVHVNGDRTVRKFHPSDFKFLYYGMTYNHPSMFVHREVYEQERYDTVLRSLSDYVFVLNQFLRHNDKFCYIQDAYVNYRLDGLSSTLGIIESLKEGDLARKKAGMNIFQRSISVVIRFLVFVIYQPIIYRRAS